MAKKSPKLTAKRRSSLPKSKFALPRKSGQHGYPVDTPGRAANAKARATQQYKKGKISKSTRDRIHAKANKALKRKRGS
jgi:hypothetical protein